MKHISRSIRRFGVIFIAALAMSTTPVWAVDINKADVAELAAELQYVGPKLAQRIVDYRNKHGAFRTADDLQKVSGIGPRVVNLNREKIQIQDDVSSGDSGRVMSAEQAKMPHTQ